MNNNIEREIFDIYMDDIIPNRFQPRLTFDDKSLNELADSIKQHGIIQPLVVRKMGDKYEIIAGERRYKASQIAGLQKVPVVIMNMNDQESAEVAVVENIQRRDLSALEEAESYKKLLDKGYLTQEQLATRMGKAQATISNKLRLLNLDSEVKDALLNDKISERHARSLLSLKTPQQQKDVLKNIMDNKLTVRQTDELIKSMITVPGDVTPVDSNPEIMETLDFTSQTDVPATTADDNVDITPFNTPLIDKPVVESIPFNVSSFVEIPEIVIHDSSLPISESNTNYDLNKVDDSTSDIQAVVDPISNVDISKIKQDATDINVIKPLADIDSLLGIKPVIESTQDVPVIAEEKEPKFRFITPAEEEEETPTGTGLVFHPTLGLNDLPKPAENNSIPEPKTYTDSLVQEYRQANGVIGDQKEIIAGNLQSAINAITDITKTIEKHNFKINVEEFDFEHLYQIIIKVQK